MKSCLPIDKYVDDSKLSETIIEISEKSLLQLAINGTVQLTRDNAMVLTLPKPTKWLSLAIKNHHDAHRDIKSASRKSFCEQIVGVYIQSDLKWTDTSIT